MTILVNGGAFRQLVGAAESFSPLASEPAQFDEAASRELLLDARRHRVVPLLVAAVEQGRVVVSGQVRDELHASLPGLLTTMAVIEHGALKAVGALTAAQLDVRVLKGLATAHLDYQNPALRQFGDVDLFVAPSDVPTAHTVLGSAGFERKHAVRGGRWEVQHAVAFDVDGIELDLHHRVLHQAAGHLMARLDLGVDPQSYRVAGQTLLALPPPLRLLQAAGQNILSAPADRKLSSDVDVLLLAPAAAEAYEIANSIQLGWLLDAALSRAHEFVGSRWRRQSADGRLGHLLASSYSKPTRSVAKQAVLEGLVAPANVTVKTALSVVMPGEEYLANRDRTRTGQLVHQLRRSTQPFRLRPKSAVEVDQRPSDR